jgi:hypothetical protein
MGCCGEVVSPENTAANRPTSISNTVANQQPEPQIGLEKVLFQQPIVSTPPPVQLQSPSWDQSFSTQFGTYAPSASPPPTFNGPNSHMSLPLLRPNSTHPSIRGSAITTSPTSMTSPLPPTSPPSLLMSHILPRPSSPPIDGKMSVAIDFGEIPFGVLGSNA